MPICGVGSYDDAVTVHHQRHAFTCTFNKKDKIITALLLLTLYLSYIY